MNPAVLIIDLHRRGVAFRVVNDRLQTCGPLTDEDRALIRANKAQLLKALTGLVKVDETGLPFRPCTCGNRHFWKDTAGWRCSDCHPIREPRFLGETCTVSGKWGGSE